MLWYRPSEKLLRGLALLVWFLIFLKSVPGLVAAPGTLLNMQ
jgi:hypothetical protein